MESYKYDNNSHLGFNANDAVNNNDNGVCFEFLFDKSLGNGKQDSTNNEVNYFSELASFGLNNKGDGSLINILNNIESNKLELDSQDNATYTLDDLLDLTAVVPTNEIGSAEPLFFDEPIDNGSFYQVKDLDNNVDLEFLELKMQSPMSSSSEDSCDLDELLFDFTDNTTEGNAALSPASLPTPSSEEVQEEVIAESTIDTDALSNDDMDILSQLGLDQSISTSGEASLNENADLATICSYLFSTQQISTFEEPTSPAASTSSSDSDESETLRFTPYKKPKKQKTPEQKQRKKAQNRTAATRYRIKKKDELKNMTDEADDLEAKNKDLRTKVDGMRTEIDYLKNLMLDVIKARLSKGNLGNVTNLLSQLS